MSRKTKKAKSDSENEKSARDLDRERETELKKKEQREKTSVQQKQRKVKRTVLQTMPYECFVSNYIALLRQNVKIGNETLNLYSKTYAVPDCNYSALTHDQQIEKLNTYMDFLNGFDRMVSLQISIINIQINRAQFEEDLLLKDTDDDLNELRHEFNGILHDKIIYGQNGLHCRKFITITAAAVNFEAASTKFFNLETHLIACLKQLGTEPIALDANERVRLLADILCDVDKEIEPVTRAEFARQAEKRLCCPDYFEFKKDYFMYNDKYARCICFKRLPASVKDTVYKDLTESNLSLVIAENIDFMDSGEAITLLQRKITDMKQETIARVKKSSAAAGAFVDPIEGTQLAVDQAQAQEFLSDLQERNQKMTLVQFIVMVTAKSYEELKKNTETINLILRKHQIETISAPYRQEQAFYSCMPIGNSFTEDKEHNIQIRRTLSSESTAVFMPFNSRELLHKGGLYYGQNKLAHNVILFDRRELKNPNGFIFGVPGSGKSMTAKIEMLFSMLSTGDEVLVLDPEREYSALAELLGGEVIYIHENATTYINPLDLTENPDLQDKEYDPIKAKLDFLLSFFSCILGNVEISPIQKTIIDNVMHEVYKKYEKPTLREYYSELEAYENKVADETRSAVVFLRQTLHLYVHGSMNVFSNATNINATKRMVVYDIKDLGKNLQTLGMMIVMENIWDRLAKNRAKGVGTRIYVDEMYLLFKSEQSATFFQELCKRARKWGGVPTGITQNVDDLLRSELARTMISNTQFVIMMSQSATDREQLSHLLKIPPEIMSYVTNASRGHGLLFADEFGTIPFDLTIPNNTTLYQTITTKFGEQKS